MGTTSQSFSGGVWDVCGAPAGTGSAIRLIAASESAAITGDEDEKSRGWREGSGCRHLALPVPFHVKPRS